MAQELGKDPSPWAEKANVSEKALFAQCFDDEDEFFYDRDRGGRFVRVQSDVLLRVLACEIGDDAFFAAVLSRYLLNTRKFFAKYPPTSIALDDPRFDPAFDYNSWCGPTNLLTLIRTAHAFEHHHRHVELTWILQPALAALFKGTRFAQTIHPFTGREGFTECYSPAILGLLDFVERLCGIQPRPDGALWFTGLVPKQIDHRDASHETAYARTVDGRRFTLSNDQSRMIATCDGTPLFSAPSGIRIITDRNGALTGVVGMRLTPVEGTIVTPQGDLAFRVEANEQLELHGGGFVRVRSPGVVLPTT